jgi:hypothetical protein
MVGGGPTLRAAAEFSEPERRFETPRNPDCGAWLVADAMRHSWPDVEGAIASTTSTISTLFVALKFE